MIVTITDVELIWIARELHSLVQQIIDHIEPLPKFLWVLSFSVLNETPIAFAIAGCAIPLSRSSTIGLRLTRGCRDFSLQRCFQFPELQ
jgi:hypothetical protein